MIVHAPASRRGRCAASSSEPNVATNFRPFSATCVSPSHLLLTLLSALCAGELDRAQGQLLQAAHLGCWCAVTQPKKPRLAHIPAFLLNFTSPNGCLLKTLS